MAKSETREFNYILAIVGAACVVGVLVFLYIASSGASAGTAAASGGMASCITFSFCFVASGSLASGLLATGTGGFFNN